MSENPWHVESIQDFAFLNCPECAFKTKEEGYFQVKNFFQQTSTQRFSDLSGGVLLIRISDVHMGHLKVSNSDFQSQVNFYVKNHSNL